MSLLDHALSLAARGWPVFPCHPATKQPLVKSDVEGEGGLKLATTDEATIRAWWKRWPIAMIGLPTGAPIGAFVVDVDAGEDKKTGEVFEAAALQLNLERAIGTALPPTLTCTTPRGGVHLYFRYPLEEIGNRTGLLGKGSRIDIRGQGGYVIAPPSARKDGVAYAWLAPDSAIAEAPVALVDLVLRRGRFSEHASLEPESSDSSGIGARAAARVKPPAGDSSIAAADEAVRKYGLSALDAELQAVRNAGSGGRNNALNEAALKLAQLVAAGALNEAFVRAALETAAADCGLIKDDGLRAVRATIDSGFRAGRKQPRDLGELRSKAAERERRGRARARSASSSPRASSAASVSASPSPPEEREKAEPTLEEGADSTADIPPVDVDPETFRYCASLDQSDVDNGKRLLAYFGRDLLVRQEDDVEAGQLLAWTGTHWDLAGGEAFAHLIAQRVGDLIKQEANYIDLSVSEARAVAEGECASRELKELNPNPVSPEDRAQVEALKLLVAAGRKARAAWSTRKSDRRKWGVSTKNGGRISQMLKCAAPHLRRHPDAFNADPLKVATSTHTLRFVPIIDEENPDPDGTRPLVDRETGRMQYRLEATPGHRREDMLTAVIPFKYDPDAPLREFTAFLDLFQPEPKKRRTVQQFSGMSLTAMPVQNVMYHTGSGGNGKSVYLEVLSRVLGDGLAVGVPAESVSGQVQNNPSAPTPDIARCYAKRFLRIAELPKDAPLKVETVKKLTGGERWPVRTMYKGYFEFKPTAKPHMSGNGEPKFDGSDGGMRRRLIIVEWTVTLSEDKRRDFEEVVSKMTAEGSGILNWLIEGALDFLNNGLVLSEDVLKKTAEHFAEMDPCQRFIDAHVRPDPGGPGVTGRTMYQGFEAWARASGVAKMFETKFGLIMKKKLVRDDTGRVRLYRDVKLVDLPEEPSHGPSPPPTDPRDQEF